MEVVREWFVRFVLPVVGLSVLLGGCSDPEGPATPDGGSAVVPQVRQPASQAVLLDASDPSELALTASQQVFEASPVAVVAEPSDDVSVRRTQAAAADLLGAPALLVGGAVSAEGVSAELERLGVQVVVAVAVEPVAPPADEAGARAASAAVDVLERTAGLAGADLVRLDAAEELGGEAMADATGAGSSSAEDEAALPADDAARLADEVDAAMAARPAGAPSSAPSASGLREVLALTDPQPGQEAAIATLRAGGAVDLAVPGGDIAGSPGAIEEIDRAQALAVVGVGPSFGDAATFAWRVSAAENGTLLPTGDQSLLPARYVTTAGRSGEEPAVVVERADAAAAAYDGLEGGPVVPTVVVPVSLRAAYAGDDGDWVAEVSLEEVRPLVEAARAAGQYVLLDVAAGSSVLREEVEPLADLIALGGVGVAVHPEARRSDGSVPAQEVSMAEVRDLLAYIEGVVTNQGLPPALVVVHQTRPESVADRPELADAVAGTDAVEVVLLADRTGASSTTPWVWDRIAGDVPAGVHLGWSGPTLDGYQRPDLVPTDPAPLLVAAS
ncbi:hypothetical protein ACNHYB_14430 [Isoptericola jiangsuensis]|uniref:hypothetical protein n=1 Tax=Isoptericola jiangsuensis TaxID=548579 RepID=UPI003AABE37C